LKQRENSLGLVPRIVGLAVVLVVDLLFFVFIGVYYPETFNMLIDSIPWQSQIKKPIIIILGLIVAVASSVAIIDTIIKCMKEIMKE